MDAQSGINHRALREHLERRREQLRIGKAEAARRAKVGRMAWWEWERGRREPHDYNYGGIEEAMQWEPGSVRAILDGGEPTVKPPDEPAKPDLRDDAEREIWALPHLTEEERWDFILLRRKRRGGNRPGRSATG